MVERMRERQARMRTAIDIAVNPVAAANHEAVEAALFHLDDEVARSTVGDQRRRSENDVRRRGSEAGATAHRTAAAQQGTRREPALLDQVRTGPDSGHAIANGRTAPSAFPRRLDDAGTGTKADTDPTIGLGPTRQRQLVTILEERTRLAGRQRHRLAAPTR
jgi:hypothetical protein